MTVNIFVTDESGNTTLNTGKFKPEHQAEMNLIKVYPERKKQMFIGFGAAATGASAYVFAQMPEDKQDEFLKLAYSDQGNAYALCRTSIQSSDFSPTSYAYVEDAKDESLSTFSIQKDEEYLIPFLKRICAINPNMQFLASPWSPPAFMKTNGSRLMGGHLKKRYYDRWAHMVVKYLQSYEEAGINISRITVQNEPNARQTWESCLMDGRTEAEFVVSHLKPALDQAGFDHVKVLIWDHNKDQIIERMDAEFSVKGLSDAISGVGFHWYSGNHFESLAELTLQYPNLEFIMTEGCVEYSAQWHSGQYKAERYATDIIGDLEAGAHAYIDWNVLLDEQGGPNHKNNFCEAPLMYDRDKNEIIVNQSHRYFWHFSHFIKPGAQRILTSRFTDAMQATSWSNIDGSIATVVLNKTGKRRTCNLHVHGNTISVELPEHSIATLVWDTSMQA